MGLELFPGIILFAIGGLCSASNFIPFRQIKRWSWEVYWPVQAFAAWIVAPALAACLLVPNCSGILSQAFQTDSRSVWLAFLFGMAWGVGAFAFGLAVRYLGITLGYAIALGFYVVSGTLAPLVYQRGSGAPTGEGAGHVTLLAAAFCAIATAFCVAAGRRKELEITVEVKLEAGERDYSLPRGAALAALAGIAGVFLSAGLEAGAPMASLAKATLMAHGRPDSWASLVPLIVVLAGGFATNFVWSAILIARNGSLKQFAGEPGINPMRAAATSRDTLVDFDPLDPSTYDRLAPSTLIVNYLLAAAAGALGCLQVVFYLAGRAKTGAPGPSSWALQIALTALFAALWGLALKEWNGTGARTKLLAALGVCLLVASALGVSYGSHLQTLMER